MIQFKTAYVAMTDDGIVRIYESTFALFKKSIKEYNVEDFRGIDSLWLFMYNPEKYDVDYGLDWELYVLDKEKDEIDDLDYFTENGVGIQAMPLDKKEFFMLNDRYRKRFLRPIK